MVEPRFKICESGTNTVVLGLENLPSNHAQLLMLLPVEDDKTLKDLQPGQSLVCRDGRRGAYGKNKHEDVEFYTVVRTE